MTTVIHIESLLRWNRPKEVQTKRGARILRTAIPDEAFWEVWMTREAELKSAGLSVNRDPYTGAWRAAWWQELPKEVTEERNKRIEMSKVTDADIFIPKPDGLEYLPFQRGGIQYCLNVFNSTKSQSSDSEPTSKGGDASPFLGDGCGVLLADEMG